MNNAKVKHDHASSRIQVDSFGHTSTPFVAVKSCQTCHLCFLAREPHLLYRSLLTALPQFALGQPGPVILYPGICQYSA